MDDAGRDGDEFGEGTMTAVVAAGDPEDLAVVAEVHVATFAVDALSAEDRGVKGHPLAGREVLHLGANAGDNSRRFVAHD